ncbi:hypothetical protein HKX48_007502 [Thoreauomyces humboldtii]|nr:hypothetical protein HKX48_007502 [Thoreauomyces humboldtii]
MASSPPQHFPGSEHETDETDAATALLLHLSAEVQRQLPLHHQHASRHAEDSHESLERLGIPRQEEHAGEDEGQNGALSNGGPSALPPTPADFDDDNHIGWSLPVLNQAPSLLPQSSPHENGDTAAESPGPVEHRREPNAPVKALKLFKARFHPYTRQTEPLPDLPISKPKPTPIGPVDPPTLPPSRWDELSDQLDARPALPELPSGPQHPQHLQLSAAPNPNPLEKPRNDLYLQQTDAFGGPTVRSIDSVTGSSLGDDSVPDAPGISDPTADPSELDFSSANVPPTSLPSLGMLSVPLPDRTFASTPVNSGEMAASDTLASKPFQFPPSYPPQQAELTAPSYPAYNPLPSHLLDASAPVYRFPPPLPLPSELHHASPTLLVAPQSPYSPHSASMGAPLLSDPLLPHQQHEQMFGLEQSPYTPRQQHQPNQQPQQQRHTPYIEPLARGSPAATRSLSAAGAAAAVAAAAAAAATQGTTLFADANGGQFSPAAAMYAAAMGIQTAGTTTAAALQGVVISPGGTRRFPCPNPTCPKVYINAGGLKGHLNKGTCNVVEWAAHAVANAAAHHMATAGGGAGPPSSVETAGDSRVNNPYFVTGDGGYVTGSHHGVLFNPDGTVADHASDGGGGGSASGLQQHHQHHQQHQHHGHQQLLQHHHQQQQQQQHQHQLHQITTKVVDPAMKPFFCLLCPQRRYKNLNGLRYHARSCHPGLVFATEIRGQDK